MSAPRSAGPRSRVILVDTNAIIEAVRSRCWNAITGAAALALETVEECRDEAQRGNHSRPGYVPVSDTQLARLHAVHGVTELERVTFTIAYPDAEGMDLGERDLFAHAFARAQRGDDVWVVCSPDKASILAAVTLGWADRVVSLEDIARSVGARPTLAEHFGEAWLSATRTAIRLAA